MLEYVKTPSEATKTALKRKSPFVLAFKIFISHEIIVILNVEMMECSKQSVRGFVLSLSQTKINRNGRFRR